MAIIKYATATHISSTIVIPVIFHNITIKFLKVLPTFRFNILYGQIFKINSFFNYQNVLIS